MKLIKTVLGGILILYFQILFASKFSILGIIPNFVLAYIIYINLENENNICLPIVFIVGLSLDLLNPHLLRMNTFIFLIVSYLISKFHHNINKKRFVVILFSILLINFIYYFLYSLYYFFAIDYAVNFYLLVLFAIFYNTIIVLISIYLFWIFDKIRLYFHV